MALDGYIDRFLLYKITLKSARIYKIQNPPEEVQ
jgi:hypothetical protein